MPTKSIPEDHHVVRYCRPHWLVANGDKITVIPQAFMLREKEPYLSISWLERQAGDRSARLRDLVQRTRVKFKNAGKKDAFAIGKVSVIKSACASHGQRVRILHEEKDWNPSYAALRRYSSEDSELLELLASDAWADLVLLEKVV